MSSIVLGVIILGAASSIVRSVCVMRRLVQEERLRVVRDKTGTPWVTVLVYGRNESDELMATVRALGEIRNELFDVVVVNDRSTDDTKEQLKRYITAHQTKRLTILQRRKISTRTECYRAAYRKSKKGDVIVCLQAGDRVDAFLLPRTVAAARGRLAWTIESAGPFLGAGLRGVVRRLRHALWSRSSRIAVYTPKGLRRAQPREYRTLPIWMGVRIVLWIGCLVFVSYGITQHTILFWYSWLAVTLYLWLAVWVEIRTPWSRRLIDMFSVPSALFLIPVASVADDIARYYRQK